MGGGGGEGNNVRSDLGPVVTLYSSTSYTK